MLESASAQRKLNELNIVLITGEPGIGKTTLAGQLCLELAADRGYQLVVIGDSIEEAEAVYRPRERQLFYFDDFLGRNYLAALDRHEDTRIVGFMRRVAQDNSKRFVLTSRTTILNQGKRLSDLFRIHNVERSEYEIRVDSLTEWDKARILYNHIWFSRLEQAYIDEILSGKRYRQIIRHKNFNPRLIAFVTDVHKLSTISSGEYWDYIERTLTNPSDIWAHVYNSQLDDFARVLLLLTVYNGGEIAEQVLRGAYEAFRALPVAGGYSGVTDFTLSAATLVGAVLNRNLSQDKSATYTLFNPSVADYVLRRTASDVPLVSAVFQSLPTERSLSNLLHLLASDLIREEDGRSILSQLVATKLNAGPEGTLEYRVMLADFALSYGRQNVEIVKAISQFLESLNLREVPLLGQWDKLASVTNRCLQTGATTPEVAARLVRECGSASLDHGGFRELCKLRAHLPGDVGKELEDILRPQIVEFWKEHIDDDIRENGVLAHLFNDDQIIEGERLVEESIDSILAEYGLAFDPKDVRAIAANVDVAYEIEANREGPGDDEDRDERGLPDWGAGVDAIDDLFSMDGPFGGST